METVTALPSGRIAIVEVSFFDPPETLAAIGWVTMNVGDRPAVGSENR